jgi:LPXTG-motif cell wall-anchored protein
MYSIRKPIPAHWHKPDYFSWKTFFLPATWFPDHTIAGKIFNVIDPLGSAVERKAMEAEKKQLEAANRAYDAAIAESQKKLAQAAKAQKEAVEKAAAGDKSQNMILILLALALLVIGILFILKKKKK